ncbi:MAG: 5-(carboxyamino)imidazole ribonucleotide synthase [Chitinophagaceae bacterium]
MLKAGILGGGQLGRMLLQEAANYPVETYVLENEEDCPAAHLCHHFVKGDINKYNDVYDFGKELDVLTIEIESVNLEALEKLETEGVKVYPRPSALKIIKNKILQKHFYTEHQINTPPFIIVQNRTELIRETSKLPAILKLSEGGYDGRGVQLLKTANDLQMGFDAPAVVEEWIDIDKEIAVIIGVNEEKQSAVFPPVEMIFDPVLNLLDYQVCPAGISEELMNQVKAIALKSVSFFHSPGIFAVEMFISKEGRLYVNETAPRVHNSGHHTIEGNYSSQYDMLWRILLGYPFGNTAIIEYSALVNLIGEKNAYGQARYCGLHEVLAMNNTFVHLYGKKLTRPGRKMGHVTLIGNDKQALMEKARSVKRVLKVIA